MSHMFYFFLALTAVLAATANAGPVLDIHGDIISNGRYYVLPIIKIVGQGGVTLTNPHMRPCPNGDLVQANSANDKGIPVRFSNWKSKVGFVPEAEDLNIQTDSGRTLCRRRNYWWLDEFDTERKNWFVVPVRKPFPENSFKSYFQIQKAGNSGTSYKIMFCPGNCIDVGISVDENGVRRLALSNNPLRVVFMKANETTTVDSSECM